MDKKVDKVIIVGAGISGLSAGIYGQMNGYKTEIYEKNPVAGGLCATWKRKNFPIDGCIHWMTGTKKGTEMRSMWDELHAFTDDDLISTDNFGTVEYEGIKVTFWCDLNKLEKELVEISPEDTKLIKKVIYMMYKIQNMPLPTDIPLSEMSLKRKISFVFGVFPYLKMYTYSKKIQRVDFAKKFKSPVLRYAFSKLVPGDGNLYSTLYAYGTVAFGNGKVLKGGSATLINNLVKSYKEVGGTIHYNSPIEKIIVEDKTAKAIQLKNGEIKEADRIITACDISQTSQLVGKKYRVKAFSKRFKSHADYPVPSCVYISLKIDLKEFEKLDISHIYQFETPSFMVGRRKEDSVSMRTYSYDKNFVVDGYALTTVLIHQTNVDYKYWDELYKNHDQYISEKERIAKAVVTRIEKKFPTMKGKIEILDVCTPKTYNRYTNAYCGSYMPFAFTSKGSIYYSNGKMRKLKNLLLANQWTVLPGGIPIAMMAGKFAIQRILKEEHKWYKITKPIRFIYKKTK